MAGLRRSAGAPRTLSLRRRQGSRERQLDLLQPAGGGTDGPEVALVGLCVDRPQHPRARPLRLVRRRGQPDPGLRPAGRPPGACHRRRGRPRPARRALLSPGQPLLDGVPQRDRADGRAVGDRPALEAQRRPELPAWRRVGGRVPAFPRVALWRDRVPEPEPDPFLDPVRRRVRCLGSLPGQRGAGLHGRTALAHPGRHGRPRRRASSGSLRGLPLRPLRRTSTPRQHGERGLPDTRLLRRRRLAARPPEGPPPSRPARAAGGGEQPRGQPPALAERLQLSVPGQGLRRVAKPPGAVNYFYPLAGRTFFVALELLR